MSQIDPLPSAVLRRICNVLGDTATGLTGREIAELLREVRIDDPGEITKRDRIFEALRARQDRDHAANAVLRCIQLALAPARFLDSPDTFEAWRDKINASLRFSSLEMNEQGQIIWLAQAATTLSEARARGNRFRDALRDRGVHHIVLSSCAPEIEDENYFHAVFETTKSLADRIRSTSGLLEDGTRLVDRAFGRASGLPVIAFNQLETTTDRSEHDGYANLLRGLFGAFRNTTAHRPKATCQ